MRLLGKAFAATMNRLDDIENEARRLVSTGQEPNWKGVGSSIFREKPYGDIRVAASSDDMKLINVSEIARERGISVTEVVRYLEQAAYKVFSWPEFEARAENLIMAALKGEAAHLGIVEVGLEYVRALTHRLIS